MKAESLALVIAEASRLESQLEDEATRLELRLEKIEEEVRQMREAIGELRGLLVKLEVTVH